MHAEKKRMLFIFSQKKKECSLFRTQDSVNAGIGKNTGLKFTKKISCNPLAATATP
jgi:hypothetical protein